MKYQTGDKIIVLHTGEEGIVVDIMNDKMLLIESNGITYPVYMDQVDFPYYKMFTGKKTATNPKIYVDNIKKEKHRAVETHTPAMLLSFVPVYNKDVFDENIVERLKLYLVNYTLTACNFKYDCVIDNLSIFGLNNSIEPAKDFYLHDISFENLNDNPVFEFEFTLKDPDKKKAPYFETSLKIKAKQLFKKIETMQANNDASFSYALFSEYPNKNEEEKVDIRTTKNAAYKIYDVSLVRQQIEAPRSVIDIHIERLTDNWRKLSNLEILTMQLKEFEKYYDLAVFHHLPKFTVIHGIGEGKLKNEIHSILRMKPEVKSFVNQYHPNYGYGATEVYF